jgi:predicted phospho-2-dehydro-3-deoxyheptonate aldolase
VVNVTESGKEIRLQRISSEGKFVIVPMDHGVSSGPISGIVDMEDTINKVAEGGATSVVLHKGIARANLGEQKGKIGFILHLSASTGLGPDPNEKVLVASVEEALRMGADCVSVHVNVGAETESDMLSDLGLVAEECAIWNVPLLAMMYPRGPEITNPYDVDLVKHVARLGCELGADIVKTNYTGSAETFSEVIKGCSIPVVIAGGPKVESDSEVLQMVYDAISAGAKGISIGRNIFQHHNIEGITRAISGIILKGMDVDSANAKINR